MERVGKSVTFMHMKFGIAQKRCIEGLYQEIDVMDCTASQVQV